MTTSWPSDRWTPIRKGKTYCSPACGGSCTQAAHDKAQREASKLAKRLGKGWKPRVWENLGWHYKAISPCGRIKVHTWKINGKDFGYHAFLGKPDFAGGRWASAMWETPQEAVEEVIRLAKEDVAEIQKAIEGL